MFMLYLAGERNLGGLMIKNGAAKCAARITSLLLSLVFILTAVSCTVREEPSQTVDTTTDAALVTSTSSSETAVTTTTTAEPEPADVTGSYLMQYYTQEEGRPDAAKLDLLRKEGRLGFMFSNIYKDHEWIFKIFDVECALSDRTVTAEYKDEEIYIKVTSDGESADVTFLDNKGEPGPYNGHYERQDDPYGESLQAAVPEPVYDPATPDGAVDAALARAAREYLGLPEGAALTADDLSKVEHIELIDETSATLNGIEYFTGLRSINVQVSNISDISPLADLKLLEDITFGFAAVDTIPDLSRCESLEYLSLQSCCISDITPVTSIRSLTHLYLSGNRITSIAPIKDMENLVEISLHNNPITDWDTIASNAQLIFALTQDYDNTMKVLDKARAIVQETITDDMNELEKEIAIYRKLHKIAESKSWSGPIMPDGYYILMKGSGICGDWAEATALLMTLAGLDCFQVGSDTHYWDIIRIDGVYYEIDCYWDDGVDPANWEYFNISRARMDKADSHHINLIHNPVANHTMMKLKYMMLINDDEIIS